jgi:integrase/recombinase XerD
MATAKIVLLTTKKLVNNRHRVVLRVTHDRKRKYYFLNNYDKNYICSTSEFDMKSGRFTREFPEWDLMNQILSNVENDARNIIRKMQFEGVEFTFTEFETDFIKKPTRKVDVFSFFDEESNRLLEAGKVGYSNIFKHTKNAIKNYWKKTDLKFRDVNYKFLINFESHLQSRQVKPNTISVYMRTFRTLFNNAIKMKLCLEKDYPFNSRNNPNGYALKDLKKDTGKRAITLQEMKKIKSFNTKENTPLFHARNYFMFSFFAMGMNFHDLALLKWKNIVNKRIEYYRAKTGGFFSIKVQPEMKAIIDWYKVNAPSDYVFPILSEKYKSPFDQYQRIKSELRKTNYSLKKIGEALKIETKLSSYVSRHSWASIQLSKGTPTAYIKEGLGHKTEEQTIVYLKKFKNNNLDKINRSILN